MLLLIYLNLLIVERVYDTFNTNYLTLAIVLILSSAFLVLYFFQVHRPIKEITRATNESVKVESFLTTLNLCLMMRLDVLECLLITWLQPNESDKFQQVPLLHISRFQISLLHHGYRKLSRYGTIPPEMLDKYIGYYAF